MKTALVWFSGILFGWGLVCLTLWGSNIECRFTILSKGYVASCIGGVF